MKIDKNTNTKLLKDKIIVLEKEFSKMKTKLSLMTQELKNSKKALILKNKKLEALKKENEDIVSQVQLLKEDLGNLMNSTKLGTIFLDHQLKIRKFTPTVKDIFNLKEADIGRSIQYFNSVL